VKWWLLVAIIFPKGFRSQLLVQNPKPMEEATASANTMEAEHKMLPPPKGSLQPTACYHNVLEKEDY